MNEAQRKSRTNTLFAKIWINGYTGVAILFNANQYSNSCKQFAQYIINYGKSNYYC